MPDVAKPVVFGTYVDPVFGTTVERITDGIAGGLNGIVPQYSKRQAWNADESKLLLFSGDGVAMLCDGNNFSYIKTLSGVGGEDVFWHPYDPDIIYYNADSILFSYDIVSEVTSVVHVFSQYTWANTRGEGNLSQDGRYYAVAGQQYDNGTGDVIFKDLVLFNLQTSAEVSIMALPQDSLSGFDWVSVSPLGSYVVVDYADEITGRYHGVEVYDSNFTFKWQKPLGAGHSDLGIDNNGDEILVMDCYNADSNKTYIKKFRLSDGHETTLLEVSELFDLHISMRNETRKAWCFISTFDYTGRLTDDSLSWLPFEDEVFALKLDGSGDVQRIAHHHSRRYSPLTYDSDHSVYWAEPHATVSRYGKRIIWGSNWRQNMDMQNSVDTYIADFSSFLGMNNPEEKAVKISVYPNPASEKLVIEIENVRGQTVDIILTAIDGRIINRLHQPVSGSGIHSVEVNIADLSAGIYWCRILAGQSFNTIKIIKIN